MKKQFKPYWQGNAQRRLKRGEAEVLYREMGGDMEYFNFFYLRYDDEYFGYIYWEYASDRAWRKAVNMTRWYAFYDKIGHCDYWCCMAMNYSCMNIDDEDFVEKDLSYENDMECLRLCIQECPDEKELNIHREFVKKHYNKTIPF